jgi:two-component system, NtrC family, sensor kinase
MIRLSNEIVGTNLVFRIADNGSGIPESFREKVFEPFVKIVKGKGVDVEMALAKRMIEKEGGKILVESHEGKGTTYALIMPLS